jgi:RNA polymerase sigma-70 factor (ECF subfamily)
MLGIFVLMAGVYTLCLYLRVFWITPLFYLLTAAIFLAFFFINRGFSRTPVSAEMLPPSWSQDKKDAFVEVSGEVAEALEEGLRIERRQEKKKLYHKVFSMDTNDWTQLHISVYAQSPEDVLLQAEEHADHERNLSRMDEAFARLTPTQARRIRARYMGGKKLREIGESEGTGESEAGHSVRSGIRRMRRYFIQQKWLKAQKED